MTATAKAAITSMDEDAWMAIAYPNAVHEDAEQRWVSDAEVAEVEFTAFTAFTGRRKGDHVTCRLIVRGGQRCRPWPVTAAPIRT